jgi:alpha-galactosidase
MRFARTIPLFCLAASAWSASLTGNWAIRQDMHDGTERRTYFDLKEEGGHITGHIRATQFYYAIKESTGGADGFTIVAAMTDVDKRERKVTYSGKLVGDELHLALAGRGGAPGNDTVAQRAPAGEGAYPARVELPALHKVRDNGLARTPPMGWNSWNKFHGRVDDAAVRGMADAIASNGMKDAGYLYVNIDDTWEGYRDAAGNIQSNKKFPDMKALADYVHGKGLKLGIYSSPGPNTCAGYEGTYGHEIQDARTYAAWGIDYLKYDWCAARNLYTAEEMQAVYQKMGDALLSSGRPIVFSLCQYGNDEVWKWGPGVGGNLWRTTGDIRDAWDSMTKIGFAQNDLAQWARPGHWNDPDMLEIGNGGMTGAQYRAQLSLWAILAAPLIAGNDLAQMSPATRAILTNREVIAVDQDSLGMEGHRVWKDGDAEIWVRPLTEGREAVVLLNRGDRPRSIRLDWSALGLPSYLPLRFRDLWRHEDLPLATGSLTLQVPPTAVRMVRETPARPQS